MNRIFVLLGITVLCIAGFLFSFLREPRRLRNGIYLFFTLMFLGISLVLVLLAISKPLALTVVLGLALLAPLAIIGLAVFLVYNGVVMIRREGRRLANLLSLFAGLGIIALIMFDTPLSHVDWTPLQVLRRSADAILAYMAFLFVCFILYSIAYGRIRTRHGLDFIVVLGSGLLHGKVPPLLASRLDRGRVLLEAQDAKGRSPLLITSGGQGRDEELPESHAMADYLVEHGVARDRLLLEDRSRTTLENLTYSAEIMRERDGDYHCAVVTNNFHVLRTALTARKVDIHGQVVGSRTALYFWPSAFIREFIAVFLEHRITNFTICGLIVAAEIIRVL